MKKYLYLCAMNKEKRYTSFSHAKTRLRYHIILCTKYRRKCLNPIRQVVLDTFLLAEKKSHFKIHRMELDEDHIHFLISFPPSYSIEQTVRRLKQFSTYHIYDVPAVAAHLRKYYWKKKRVLWTHGYFCSTIGEVSEERLKEYIENQG